VTRGPVRSDQRRRREISVAPRPIRASLAGTTAPIDERIRVSAGLRQRLLTRGRSLALALGEHAFNAIAIGPLEGLRRFPPLNRARARWHDTLDPEFGLDDVREVLDALDRAGVTAWLGGGWGVDALVGSQTRRHADLDLVVDTGDLDELVGVLSGLGFRRVAVRPEPAGFLLDHQLVRDPGGRLIDLHVVDARDWPPGNASGPAFTSGSLHGRAVRCLSVETHRSACRRGFELKDDKPEYHLNLRLLDELEGRAS
jgi:lincosamide nucleotidyltransferase A/C/D/E